MHDINSTQVARRRFGVLTVTIIVIAAMSVAGCSLNTGGNLSVENVTKVKPGMTLAEVQKIVGARGRKATQSDLDQVNAKKKRFGQGSLITLSAGSTMHCWRKGNTWFFVNIDNNSNKASFITRWSSS